ncbi:hypothetical protein PI125_g13072 [Phytophthora idaei]|nr:hypothetical protein PI125_g13072 [Phytophthora idaei]
MPVCAKQFLIVRCFCMASHISLLVAVSFIHYSSSMFEDVRDYCLCRGLL